jgi:hypothetical protein
MLIIAALLTFAVGLMHTWIGGKRLIRPILGMQGLPVILGSVERSKLTLATGWHASSLTWWGISAVLACMHFSPENAAAAFLWMVTAVFSVIGLAALVLSRGAHLSWIFFLPIAAITGYAACMS